MKVIKKGLVFYISIIILSIIFHGCRDCNIMIVGKGDATVFLNDVSGGNDIDTIRNEFGLYIQLEMKYSIKLDDLSLITKSYASQPCDTYGNSIIRDSIKIYCDKDFYFEEELITANSDILDYDELFIRIMKEDGTIEIVFLQEFIDKSEFQKEDHKFLVDVLTTDDLKFQYEFSTYLDL